MNMYLIQRHGKGKPYHPDATINVTYPLDYMGAAEFEWGAYGDIMCVLHAHSDTIDHQVIDVVDNGTLVQLNVFYSPVVVQKQFKSTVENLLESIKLLNNELVQMKEHTDFYRATKPRLVFSRAVAWTDIRHGMFFTADDLSLDQFRALVFNTVKSLNLTRGDHVTQ